MHLPTIKSVTDIRKDAKNVFEQVKARDEVVVVTKNNDKLSVIISPDYFQSIVDENEALWEEIEMTRSKKDTKGEKSYKLWDIINSKI